MLGGWSAISGMWMWMWCGAERENCIRVWCYLDITVKSVLKGIVVWKDLPVMEQRLTKMEVERGHVCMEGKMHKHSPGIQGPFLVGVLFLFLCVAKLLSGLVGLKTIVLKGSCFGIKAKLRRLMPLIHLNLNLVGKVH